jgi:hypothetical protein
MKKAAAIFFTSLALLVHGAEAENALVIAVKPKGYGDRLPLLQEIPVSKTKTINIKLLEIDGQCHLHMGNLKANLNIPAPCDVKTKGADYGFKPAVNYDANTDNITVATEVTFSIVGGLKFYPDRRTECGEHRRVVKLKFSKNPIGSGLDPFLDMSEIIPRQSNLSSHCPRQYDTLK